MDLGSFPDIFQFIPTTLEILANVFMENAEELSDTPLHFLESLVKIHRKVEPPLTNVQVSQIVALYMFLLHRNYGSLTETK